MLLPQVDPGSTIAVWFSCGAASALAAKLTLDRYGQTCRVLVLNNPVIEEHPDNRRFLSDIEKWLGQEIVSVNSSKFPTQSAEDVWIKERYMSGVAGAPCTKFLKKFARQEMEAIEKIDWHVLGFTSEERTRHKNFVTYERSNLIPILIAGDFSKQDCADLISASGINLPEIYRLGYPNANCIGCVKSSSPKYWNLVRSTFPDVFSKRAELSRQLGARLVEYKGTRIYLDELSADAKGGKIKTVECGIFCEEKE